MAEHVQVRLRASAIAAATIAAAGITLFALIVVSARYPLPIPIGAWRGPLFAALTLSVAFATAAVASEPSSRHPSLTMPRTERYWVLVWWIGVFTALALLSYAAWKAWEVVAMFAALIALVKVLQVASFIKQDRSVRSVASVRRDHGPVPLRGGDRSVPRPTQPPAADPGRDGRISRCTHFVCPGEPTGSGSLGDRSDLASERGRGSPAASRQRSSLIRSTERGVGPRLRGRYRLPSSAGVGRRRRSTGMALGSRTGCLCGPALKGSNFLVVSWSTEVANRYRQRRRCSALALIQSSAQFDALVRGLVRALLDPGWGALFSGGKANSTGCERSRKRQESPTAWPGPRPAAARASAAMWIKTSAPANIVGASRMWTTRQ